MVRPLPNLMVAPTGARRSKADHPALPITDTEIIETARLCQDAGADGIHLHIRDTQGRHLLDAAHYRALLDRLNDEVPQMYLQVTSEAAGRYTATEQRAVMRDLRPAHVSVALREMVRDPEDWPEARYFYHWAYDSGVEIQHILYSPDDDRAFIAAYEKGLIPDQTHLMIFVLGSYATGSRDGVALENYLEPFAKRDDIAFDWMTCAFGSAETESLLQAVQLGGKMRVGFENSLWHQDGTLAKDNTERVRALVESLKSLDPSGQNNSAK